MCPVLNQPEAKHLQASPFAVAPQYAVKVQQNPQQLLGFGKCSKPSWSHSLHPLLVQIFMQFPGDKVHLRKTVEWNSWIACTFICGQCLKHMFKKKCTKARQWRWQLTVIYMHIQLYWYRTVHLAASEHQGTDNWASTMPVIHSEESTSFAATKLRGLVTREIFGWEEYQHMVQVPTFF